MANFRNILVHAYLGINRDMVYSYLSELGDFRSFIGFLDKYLDAESAGWTSLSKTLPLKSLTDELAPASGESHGQARPLRRSTLLRHP